MDAGVPIRFWTSSGYMHHKFAVVGGKKIVTGSLNWTGRGETTNHENLLVFEDASLAQAYLEEWRRLPCDDQPPEKSLEEEADELD